MWAGFRKWSKWCSHLNSPTSKLCCNSVLSLFSLRMISISEWPFCGQKRYSAKQHPHTPQPQIVLQSGAKPLNSVSLLRTFLLCTCILQVIKYWKQWGSRDRTRIHVHTQLDSPVPRSRNIVPQCGFFLNLPHCALIGIEKKAYSYVLLHVSFQSDFQRLQYTVHT